MKKKKKPISEILRHWYYVNKIYIKKYKRLSLDVLLHDLDKVVSLIFKGYYIKEIHRINRNHHSEWMLLNPKKVKINNIRHAICDWESCRFTKINKQKTNLEFWNSDESKRFKESELYAKVENEVLKFNNKLGSK